MNLTPEELEFLRTRHGLYIENQNAQAKLQRSGHRYCPACGSIHPITYFSGNPRMASGLNNRCKLCGRSRAYYRKFQICRICFRDLASEGKIPGVKKASW